MPTIGAQVVYALAEPYEVIVNAVDLNARDGINTFAVIDGMMTVTYNQRLDNAINQIYEAIGSGGSGGSGGAVASVNGKTGRVIFNAEDVGALPNIPASSEVLGGVKVGKNLIIDETGALSVDTASFVEEDNTRPITSAAVHATVGNIEILLGTI